MELFNKIKENVEISNDRKITCVKIEDNKIIHDRNICKEDCNSGVCSVFIGCYLIEAKRRFKEKLYIHDHIDIIELL
ncbi:MAG: hypothetical protein KatS3mg003_1476 [Candidatus Nitrosocaldaceae archaeon]|nr:MAG: hypothetical protein KatS3mg003_1476 [Candidatus Nitrosocaldaceae archaeon]